MRKKKVAKKTIKKKSLNKRPPRKKKPVAKPAKYLKVLATESRARFVEVGEMIQNKEIKWVCFSVENQVGVYYYLILNGKKK